MGALAVLGPKFAGPVVMKLLGGLRVEAVAAGSSQLCVSTGA